MIDPKSIAVAAGLAVFLIVCGGMAMLRYFGRKRYAAWKAKDPSLRG